MYVCICNALTERRVRGAIEAGAGSLGAVYRTCGVAPQCGKCGEMIRSYLLANDEAGGTPATVSAAVRQAVA